ncbi:hypothetical protein SAM40697_6551 [Streptomyces ambofaciens]|uniref:Transposase n=1 Tax=Streptomyces ambofaciens TaxID=1889 RepID=A0ABM6B9H2_STRAM|nr:hypothetical protein [Streptomyces ambofaciens]ANB10504.1 hypothetical protein SAM40697_6551 [Streptomyces ambofaciens]
MAASGSGNRRKRHLVAHSPGLLLTVTVTWLDEGHRAAEQPADDEVRVGSAQVAAAGEHRPAHPMPLR